MLCYVLNSQFIVSHIWNVGARKNRLWGLNVKNSRWNVLYAVLFLLSQYYGYYHFSMVVFILLTMFSTWKPKCNMNFFLIESKFFRHLKYAPDDYLLLKMYCMYLPLCARAKQACLQINSTAYTFWRHLGGRWRQGRCCLASCSIV